MFKKLPKLDNRLMGGNSTNGVTLFVETLMEKGWKKKTMELKLEKAFIDRDGSGTIHGLESGRLGELKFSGKFKLCT
jgi:hypothetical protein